MEIRLLGKRIIVVVALILTFEAALSAERGFSSGASAGEQAGVSSPEQLHGVLSSQRLAPPLRGPARHVRFSPDGTHIMIQDEAGGYVLPPPPLNLTRSITRPRTLVARLSADPKQ